MLIEPSTAGADSSGGASSRVTIDGDILTSILFPPTRPGPRTRGGPAPSTRWVTLPDAAIDFVLRVAAQHPDVARCPDPRRHPCDGDRSARADDDLQVRLVDGVPSGDVRFRDAAVVSPARVFSRQMVTELPILPFRSSPPRTAPGTAPVPVPVNEPVFVWFDPATWATTVERTLTAGGITAMVRARPVRTLVWSGDPDPTLIGTSVGCGPGMPFDPSDPRSPARQAELPGRCAPTYRTVTGVAGRRDEWFGSVTVVWQAEWSRTGGLTWEDLGDIPKVSPMPRSVIALASRIESFTPCSGPSRAACP